MFDIYCNYYSLMPLENRIMTEWKILLVIHPCQKQRTGPRQRQILLTVSRMLLTSKWPSRTWSWRTTIWLPVIYIYIPGQMTNYGLITIILFLFKGILTITVNKLMDSYGRQTPEDINIFEDLRRHFVSLKGMICFTRSMLINVI